MAFPENKIYLASRSLRRRELLKQIGVKFKILLMRETLSRPSDIDETPFKDESPNDYVYRITSTKAEASWLRLTQRQLPLLPVLVADTVVSLDGCILGKPKNQAHAEEMLTALSGRSHQVLTAIGIVFKNKTQIKLSTTTVRFRDITPQEIRYCIDYDNVYDKAGAYAIQGLAAVFISEINGSYSGVKGLPLFETSQLLEEVGIEIFK
ncbi:septum formation protein [Nitrosomonas marina]|uniref:dTTP/UTP pyrophosphatase n=1 Tax=Nitrosomonas marina TaxID=917 RepID=A0A1I0DIT1_9PROT|nr:Maf family protein [Nitrosomonas marina]SET32246.1 septum formation protein [Nitrosomonas marina]